MCLFLREEEILSIDLISSNGGCQTATIIAMQCTVVVPENLWPRVVKCLRSFLNHRQWFVKNLERQGKLQRTRKVLKLRCWLNSVNQGCPQKSWCPGHCSLACTEDLVVCLSGLSHRQTELLCSLYSTSGVTLISVPASIMLAPSNCESILKNDIVRTWISQAQLVWHQSQTKSWLSRYGRWIKR